MRLLIDNQLPQKLAEHLRGRGHDCVHVADLGLDEALDVALWARALAEQRIVVSKDEDFVLLANRAGDLGRLIWVRLGNTRNEPLLAAFDKVHDDIVAAFDAGQRIVEVR
jgi:predicted nuclease of predicted toxin-antitoxin system